MKTFKEFLKEGGNIKIGEYSADPIPITEKTRKQTALDVHDALHDLHRSFEKEHGAFLFGKNAKALFSGSAYSGSTRHLVNENLPTSEFAQYKPTLGDIDVQVPREHMANLGVHLQEGKKIGKYTILGINRTGGEHHILAKHENGQIHQIDFEGVNYKDDEPTKFDQLSHNADWEDIKQGIKGLHHKILLNAAGGKKYKFSMLYGLGNREGETNWDNDTSSITKKLFGQKANESSIQSFVNLTDAIKKYIPKNQHQAIYDKFKESMISHKKIDHTAAFAHLQRSLGVND